MPELRLVVLVLQERLAYGPTFDSAMKALFGGEASSLSAPPVEAAGNAPPSSATKRPTSDLNALIAGAAKDLADYQRLTAEGKLGEAGQKLEQRSEERRVGKECRSRWSAYHRTEKT